ncbi:MAG: hypothetical protein F6J87_17450 [Spirulina sp. SIO3F2]|nr:hypothetical protein [Spirulina sp. SIO3F2]
MSQLTEALNRIMKWLEKHQPEYAASFLPGLSRQEIDKLIAPLNLCIPEEIYELYQWRNGRSVEPIIYADIPNFDIYNFLPLKEVLKPDVIDWINLSPFDGGFLTAEYQNKTFFPFIGFEPTTCAVVISDKQEEHYPVVVLYSEGSEPTLYAISITTMMSMCADAYETGAYYVDDKDRRYVNTDHNKLIEILDKYHAFD